MTIDSIMTHRVIFIDMDATLQQVRKIFTTQNFHHLLVVEDQKLIGVISDRDLLREISPFVDTPSEGTRDKETLKKKAHQVMTRKPVTVNKEMEIKDAVSLLMTNDVSCLPVISDQDEIEGIVTLRDILRYYIDCADIENEYE